MVHKKKSINFIEKLGKFSKNDRQKNSAEDKQKCYVKEGPHTICVTTKNGLLSKFTNLKSFHRSFVSSQLKREKHPTGFELNETNKFHCKKVYKHNSIERTHTQDNGKVEENPSNREYYNAKNEVYSIAENDTPKSLDRKFLKSGIFIDKISISIQTLASNL